MSVNYATHHKSGREVAILNQSVSTYKDKKTLVWLNPSTIDSSISWNRFDVGCVSLEHYTKLQELNIHVDVLICLKKEETEWIRKNVKKVKIIFASSEILETLTESFFQQNKVSNLLGLKELHLLYSFLESEWDGSAEDACVLVSLVLRYLETFPLPETKRNTYSLKVSNTLQTPKPLWFITQYYMPKEKSRKVELLKCLANNVKNPFIDKIVLLNEQTVQFEKNPKITEKVIGKRLHYSDVFQYIYNEVPKDVIVVFANADIYLDETVRNLWSVSMEHKFFALLRYENGEIYGPRPDSQDTWVISSTSVKSRSNNYKDIDFSFGVMGCDNAITMEALKMKYLVVNPALTIRTHHLHDSNIRNYVKDDMVEKDKILYIEATALHDMEAVISFKQEAFKKFDFDSFDRLILCSNDNKAKTFCSMISKGENPRYKYSQSSNSYKPKSTDIQRLDNVFQTNTGLVYGYDKIYVGKSDTGKEAWANCQLSTLTPTVGSDIIYSAYIPDEYVKNVETYMLYYLSKILLMRCVIKEDGEFWCLNEPSFIDVMKQFRWNKKVMPLLSRNENELIFSKKAYVWPVNDEKEVSREQIMALRSFIRAYPPENNTTITVFVDETFVNKKFVSSLEKIYENVNCISTGTSIQNKIAYLQHSNLTILSSSASLINAYGWLWCMKPNTVVYDIQNEMAMNGEILHLANACELKYHFTTVPRNGLTEALTNRILDEIQNLNKSEEVVGEMIPTILVPKKCDGFFNHAGDSFREMVDIWAERGYVKKVESDCKNIWMNRVGDTLLYDRPNYDWIKNAPAEEQVWKNALFGNPKPLGGKGKAWSFWPRRPRLVEAMLNKSFEKTRGLVFYGKIENAVQRNNRTKYDWSSCCEKFFLGSENEPPIFSEQKYLDNLSKAKYGLCLAGYGKKCHREVECMALGTVPVCAPEVDMDSYVNPPVEGIHYLRVQNPEDAKLKLSVISDLVWKDMSEHCKKWYLENCSAEGMWNLTKKLTL